MVMARWGLASLGFVRSLAKGIPIETVEEKLTVETFKNQCKQKYPDLYKVLEEEGEKADRWIEAEIRKDIIPWLGGAAPTATKPAGQAASSPQ